VHNKVDEDLPKQVVTVLRENGHQADSVIEQGLSGWKDDKLWDKIQTEKRFLITADKGFADIRIYPPGTHAGIMLLRPDQDGIRPTLDLLKIVLKNYNLDVLAGKTTVITPRGIRVRRNL
jgi:predicted nuclease of predicted toxin-antitoxin system